jgi:hypothetical protein
MIAKVNKAKFDTRSATTIARYTQLPRHYLQTIPFLSNPARYLVLLGEAYAPTSALSMAQTLMAVAHKRKELASLIKDPQTEVALTWLKKRAAVYRAQGKERKAVHIPILIMKAIIIATWKKNHSLGFSILLAFVTASRRADLGAFHLQEESTTTSKPHIHLPPLPAQLLEITGMA